MVAVLLTFAALVLMGSPLGIASSMFASIALGIGVDYSIHLAVEIRAACARAPSLLVALRRAIAETAPSIIVSAATITVGFGVLLVSSVVPNRMLGLLVIVSLGMCALMTLALVPGLADLLGMWRATRRQREHVAASGVSLSRRRRIPGPLPVVGVVAESTKAGTMSGNGTS
jgi:predicted RND superfamily exporter protein